MRALLLIDLQYDFCPGGALAVAEGDQVIAVANHLIPKVDVVVASQDWHPANHGSFASQHPGSQPGELSSLNGLPQILWPDHCVQGTRGAELHDDLNKAGIHDIVFKGQDPGVDSYSAFFDNGRRHATGLEALLRSKGVSEVWVMGLATDYCVRWSVLDALSLGFRVIVVRDGCRGVELNPGDCDQAFGEMAQKGALIVDSALLASQ